MSLQKFPRAAASPSRAIWDQVPVRSLESGERRGFHHFNDFTDDVATVDLLSGWTVTFDAGGGISLTPTAAHGGAAEFVAGGTADDLIQAQMGRAAFIDLDKIELFAMEMRLKLDDVDTIALFLGLSDTETSIMGASAINTSDYVGWFSADNAATAAAQQNTTATSVANPTMSETVTLVDDTYVKLGLVLGPDGHQAKWYYDDEQEHSSVTSNPQDSAKIVASEDTTARPSSLLRPSFAISDASTGAGVMTVDWIRVAGVFDDL